jgi:hypothetical protein
MMAAMVDNASTIVTVDLIDEITMTAGPILAMTIGIDVIIAATTAAMTDVKIIVAMTATTGATTTSDRHDDHHDDCHNDRQDDQRDDQRRQDSTTTAQRGQLQ